MRYDYVKAAAKVEYDRAEDMAKLWYSIFPPDTTDDPPMKQSNVRSVRKYDDKTFLYVFEAWGEVCEQVYNLDWSFWSPYMDRLDIREDMQLTRDGVDNLYHHLRESKAGNKNVTMYDSRQRTKRNGRDTGGYGIALGSHKSDLRTTFYVRGFSGGAYEFQCTGAKLTNKIQGVQLLKGTKNAPDDASLWDNLSLALWAQGWQDATKTLGISQDDILALAAGVPQDDTSIENLLAAVDEMIDRLPKEALFSIVDTIQAKLAS